MFQTFKKEWEAKVLLVFFLLFTLWWIILKFVPLSGFLAPEIYGATYGLIALWGAICGIGIAKKWGFTKSVMGRAILFFSAGLFAQEFGQIVYSYYNVYLKMDSPPYPSLGDVGYFGSIFLYILGVLLLAKASGAHIKLQSFVNKLQAILLPLIMLIIAYALFLKDYQFDWTHPLTVLLDFGYPFGQAIYLSLALLTYLLSRGMLGGILKSKIIFFLIALFTQFLSDYTYLYQNKQGTWTVAGINDFLYSLAYFLMALSIIQLLTVYKKLQGEK